MTLTNEEISKFPDDRDIRGIKPVTLQRYGVHTSLTPEGDVANHYYPVTVKKALHCYKTRTPAKKFFKTKKIEELEPDLFGIPTVAGKVEHLVITEGELDAMMTYQILKPMTKSLVVLSLLDGSKGMGAVKTNRELLSSAYNLYFYPDQDEPGMMAVKEMVKLFPEINIIYTTEKDACDMYKEGKAEELKNAFRNAERYRPKAVLTVSDIRVEAIKPVTMGLSYPWEDMTNLTYGAKTQRIIGIGAAPGAGKTVFLQQIQKHFVYEHGEKIGIFALEESPEYSLKKLVGSVMGEPIHIPGYEYDVDAADEVAETFEDRILFYDSNEYTDWSDIEETIRYFASEGVKFFFIDPLSALVSHLDSGEGNKYLNSAMYTLSKMVKSLDIAVYHVNHLNNPKTGLDHSEGGKIHGGQFTGSKAQWRFSTDMWGLIRNQKAEDEEERNLSQIQVIKDRMVGNGGKSFYLTYDAKSGLLVPAHGTSGIF